MGTLYESLRTLAQKFSELRVLKQNVLPPHPFSPKLTTTTPSTDTALWNKLLMSACCNTVQRKVSDKTHFNRNKSLTMQSDATSMSGLAVFKLIGIPSLCNWNRKVFNCDQKLSDDSTQQTQVLIVAPVDSLHRPSYLSLAYCVFFCHLLQWA